jgi:type IV pilus assembly protein PilN
MMSRLRLPSLDRLTGRASREEEGPAGAGSGPPALDLVRERRQEFGQRTIRPLLDNRRNLVLQGVFVGGGVFGVVLAITTLVFLRLQLIHAEMGRYSTAESQAADLRQRINAANQTIQGISANSKELSEKITNVRPTSALLSELQLRIPAGIQLQSAEAADANLQLRGVSAEPSAYGRINALQLELRRSPLFDPLGVTLSRLDRSGDSTAANAAQGAAPGVQFTITARFATLPPAQLQQILTQLGSVGMARRLELMRQEGLLP